jgi:multiple sugar transport system substrate-binding protein
VLSPAPAATSTTTTVTVRLWDDQVAQAYAESFAEFSRRNPDVTVALDVVPYADYFATLPDTLAAGRPDARRTGPAGRAGRGQRGDPIGLS